MSEPIYSDRNRYDAIERRIRAQFPDGACGSLFCRVVTMAIQDFVLFDADVEPRRGGNPQKDRYSRQLMLDREAHRQSAHRYLMGDMWHASLCDVDPDWIRRTIRMAGFDLPVVINK